MDVFYALAEPRRRRIIELLASNGQLNATQIYGRFDITAQAVSQHLRVLLDAGIVLMRKRAQQHIYELNTASLSEVEEWIRKNERIWNERLDTLGDVLLEEKKKAYKRR
jgi:DNA-binding transcriptional ArsR family regulator